MATVVAFRLMGLVGVVAALLASSATWLILTQPAVVVDTIADGDVARFLYAIVQSLVHAVQAAVKLL